MKYIALFIFLFYSAKSSAQSHYTEIGAVGSLYKNKGNNVGGQYNVNFQYRTNILLGNGTQVLFFKDMKGMYIPVYGRLGYNIPAKRFVISTHVDPGYGFYKHSEPSGLFADDKQITKGGFYFSSGLSIMGRKKFSPYFGISYSSYQFRTKNYITNYRTNINAITASIGLCLQFRPKYLP